MDHLKMIFPLNISPIKICNGVQFKKFKKSVIQCPVFFFNLNMGDGYWKKIKSHL